MLRALASPGGLHLKLPQCYYVEPDCHGQDTSSASSSNDWPCNIGPLAPRDSLDTTNPSMHRPTVGWHKICLLKGVNCSDTPIVDNVVTVLAVDPCGTAALQRLMQLLGFRIL